MRWRGGKNKSSLFEKAAFRFELSDLGCPNSPRRQSSHTTRKGVIGMGLRGVLEVLYLALKILLLLEQVFSRYKTRRTTQRNSHHG